MQPRTTYAIILVALTLLVLALRLAISFEVAEPGYGSYFSLLQAESIRETGTPRFDDAHSYQGRRFVFSTAYYYLVALATLFLPAIMAVKLLPNLAMALLIPAIYLLSYQLTKSRWASLSAAFFGAFVPSLFTGFLNEAAPFSLALPLLIFAIHSLLTVEKSPNRAFLLLALLTLISPIVWLLIASLIIYILILLTERLKPSAAFLETSLFALLFASWHTLIVYKPALQRSGLAILHGSLPAGFKEAIFQEFTLLTMLYAVGIVPLALGGFALYHAAFEVRSKRALLIGSLLLTTLLAALFRLIPLQRALLLLSVAFILLAANSLHLLSNYVKKTRFPHLHTPLITFFILFFLLTSLLPSLATGIYPQSSPTPNELAAVAWLEANTPPDAVIAAAPKTGFLLNHVAKRQYIIDEAYLNSPRPEAALRSLDTLYTSPSTVAAVREAERLGVTHILLGPAEYARYASLGAVVKDRDCFPVIYQDERVVILERGCGLRGGDE